MYVNLKQLNKQIKFSDLSLTLDNLIQMIKQQHGIKIETRSVLIFNEELLENLNQTLNELSPKSKELDIQFSQQVKIQFKNELPSDDFEQEIDLWDNGNSLIEIIKKKFISLNDYPIKLKFQDQDIDLDKILIEQNIVHNSVLNYSLQVIIDVEYENNIRQFTYDSFQTVKSFKQHIIASFKLQGLDFDLKYKEVFLKSYEIFFNNYEPKITVQIVKGDQNGEKRFESEELKNQTDSNYFSQELYPQKQLRIQLIDSEQQIAVQEFHQISDFIQYIKNQKLEYEKFSFHQQIIVPKPEIMIQGDVQEVIYFSRMFEVIFLTQGEKIYNKKFQNDATLEQIKTDFMKLNFKIIGEQNPIKECEIQFYYKDTLLEQRDLQISQYIDGNFKVEIEVKSKEIQYKIIENDVELDYVLFIQIHETIKSLRRKISNFLDKQECEISLFYDGTILQNDQQTIFQLKNNEIMEFEVY